ncbi:MAG: MBL fold metallo-hydrolase RNA specificity domain-containing protein [Ignavibacteriales bacterium]
MRLTFYDGCDRIGGNKFLLEADGTAIFLDFGTSFAGEREYFDEFLIPRATHGIGDLLDLGILPPVRGIYRPDLDPPGRGWWERARVRAGFRDDVRVDGLLLTHGHVDHTGYASYLSSEIPVYCSSTTAIVSKAMQDVAPQGMGREVCYVTPRELKGCGLLGSMNAKKTPAEQRQFVFMDRLPSSEGFREFWRRTGSTRDLISREPVTGATVGNLEIRYWPVDHSIPGSGAFGIRTTGGWIVYTGDLRLHGRAAPATRRFIAEAAALKPLALIVEGTHPTPHDPVSEDDVLANALEAVRNAESLVIADFGPRNVERLLSFLEIAGRCGRRLAVSSKDAYLLHALSISGETGVPDPFSDGRIAIYVEARSLKAAWEKTLLETCMAHGKTVDCRAVSRRPGEFILCFSYYDLNELLDIQPDGGTYIYSSSEAFNEEMHMDLDKLRNWINHFGVRLVGDPGDRDGVGRERGFHASGHINGPGLIELVEEIQPEYLIPVHTEQPDFFADRFEGRFRLLIPRAGDEIALPPGRP